MLIKKQPPFYFPEYFSEFGLNYWIFYIFEINIRFYLGQKENFEYKNFSDRVLVAELWPGKDKVCLKVTKHK